MKPIQKSKRPEQDRIIKMAELERICGMSRSTIYSEMKMKRFPPQVKLTTRGVGWSQNEVQKWIAAQKNVRRD
jgi:prophage regulatory protein